MTGCLLQCSADMWGIWLQVESPTHDVCGLLGLLRAGTRSSSGMGRQTPCTGALAVAAVPIRLNIGEHFGSLMAASAKCVDCSIYSMQLEHAMP
jgi:hypothetical protein